MGQNGSTVKGKNVPQIRSTFFPLRSGSFSGGYYCAGKKKRSKMLTDLADTEGMNKV